MFTVVWFKCVCVFIYLFVYLYDCVFILILLLNVTCSTGKQIAKKKGKSRVRGE